MKKILSVLVLCLLFPTLAVAFTDVNEGYRYHAAITYLEENEVVQGYEDGSFQPDQEVTRAEALKMILVGSGIEISESESYDFPFSDLENDAWYLPYLYEGYVSEIATGYDDGTFKPHQTINLAETLKMLILANGVEAESTEEDPFPDVDAGVWFAPYAAYAEDLNLIEPEDDGLMHADQNVTRGELAEIMYRLMYIEENGLSEFDISLNWQSYQNELGYEVKYPYGWTVVTADDGGIVLWNKDEWNNQTGWDRQYPNSASVSIFVNENVDGLNSGEFFMDVIDDLDYEEAEFREITVNGLYGFQVFLESSVEPILDTYVYLPNDTILAMYGSWGAGDLSEHSQNEVYAVEMSAVYVEDAVTSITEWEAIVEEARILLQVDGMGNYALQLFDDRVLIETDTIGVGTGPVDYYYSAGANVTLKYERSYDVMLDLMEGQTTAF